LTIDKCLNDEYKRWPMTTKKFPDKTFDVRTLDYSISNGYTTEKEYEKYLNELPDEEGNYELVTLEDETAGDSEES